MKHRKALLVSIWILAIGITLFIISPYVVQLGMIYHAGGWFSSGYYEYTWVAFFGVALFWGSIVTAICGVFGLVTTVILELTDEKKVVKP